MSAVNHIGGKTHVYGTICYLFYLFRYNSQILRTVNLTAQLIFNIQRFNQAPFRHLIKCIFRIAFHTITLTERHDIRQPYFPVMLFNFIQRLCCNCFIKKFNANLGNVPVMYNRFKIFFRKRECRTNRHAAFLVIHYRIKDCTFKYQIAMHE